MTVTEVCSFYSKQKRAFVNDIAELAQKPSSIPEMFDVKILLDLKPLLKDREAFIHRTAALAIGRLAANSIDFAHEIIHIHGSDIMGEIVKALTVKDPIFQKTAAFVIRSIAKHGDEYARQCISFGVCDGLVACLEEIDVHVREACAWALGYLALHSEELAKVVVDHGAIPLMLLSLKEPEISLKRICISSISDIVKHSSELATIVKDQGALKLLVKFVRHKDTKLRKQTVSCICQIAKHSPELALAVADTNVLKQIVMGLRDPESSVRRASAQCVLEVVKHSEELANLTMGHGAGPALVDFIAHSHGDECSSAIVAVGYIGAFGESLAGQLLESNVVPVIKDVLSCSDADHIKSAAAWTLGQLTRHSSKHADMVADCDVFRCLMLHATDEHASEDLRLKAKRALKSGIRQCSDLSSLRPLLADAPTNILKHILQKLMTDLPNDSSQKRQFVQAGGLKQLQVCVCVLFVEDIVSSSY
eukprot:TRINITY_DN22374_c1_g1_i2.p1 TRINITY_DN22374_c1_g1~~TRINITY_DN22374_c1_g1_i2.p1  ORF type:complete len:477 (+),score=128.79 TRINITY_DN22374_c1_g1_i2:117-1547(+)